MRDHSPSELRRIAGDPRSPLPILSFLEAEPSWARDATIAHVGVDGPGRVESLVSAVAGNDGAVVLIDAALAVSVDPTWIECIQSEIGPVVIVGGLATDTRALRELDVAGCVPDSIREVPAELARAILADHVRLDDRQAARARAEDAEVGGGERFVRDALHEFRTPLTVISEFVGLCEDGIGGPLTEKQRCYLGYVQEAVQRLCREFDDYRDTIRMQLGSLPFSPSSAPLERVVRAALAATDIPVEGSVMPSGDTVLNGIEERRTQLTFDRVLRAAGKLAASDEPLGVCVEEAPGGHAISFAFTGRAPAPVDVEVMRSGVVESEDGPYRSVARVFGLGVAMAHQFLRASGGDLHLEPRPDGGALVVTVPTVTIQSAGIGAATP